MGVIKFDDSLRNVDSKKQNYKGQQKDDLDDLQLSKDEIIKNYELK